MTAGRTNHTRFAGAPKSINDFTWAEPSFPEGLHVLSVHSAEVVDSMSEAELRAFIFGEVRPQHNQDPCPSCDGDEYDNAAGDCSECGHTDSEGGEL